jgi:hypothetical protein
LLTALRRWVEPAGHQRRDTGLWLSITMSATRCGWTVARQR